MKHDHRTQKRMPRNKGLIYKLFAKPNRLPATVTHEQDFDDDVPSIKLSTAFMVIVFLHVAVVGGVMLFRFMERDTGAALAGNPANPGGSSGSNLTNSGENSGIKLDDPALKGYPTHRVKPLETIDMIAGMHNVTRDDITRTNRLNADNPFREGMTLVIPPAEAAAAAPAAVAGDVKPQGGPKALPRVAAARPVEEMKVAPARMVLEQSDPVKVAPARPVLAEGTTKPVVSSRGTKEHTMKKGDTLWGIAKKNGVKVEDILKANGISDATKVQLGAKLKIPSGN